MKLVAAVVSAIGVLVTVAGIALVNVPAAMIVGGVALTVVGLLGIDVGGKR